LLLEAEDTGLAAAAALFEEIDFLERSPSDQSLSDCQLQHPPKNGQIPVNDGWSCAALQSHNLELLDILGSNIAEPRGIEVFVQGRNARLVRPLRIGVLNRIEKLLGPSLSRRKG
jgi:hypothetical protein